MNMLSFQVISTIGGILFWALALGADIADSDSYSRDGFSCRFEVMDVSQSRIHFHHHRFTSCGRYKAVDSFPLEKRLYPYQDMRERLVSFSGIYQSRLDDLPLGTRLSWHDLVSKKVRDSMSAEESADARRSAAAFREAMARESATRRLLEMTYSGRDLETQMLWFWLNHFSVFKGKGTVNLMLDDYTNALRPHVFGKFRDLVRASMTHPAMLLYLDNTRSRKDRPNENYARELMELHTLGVDGGYSQHDVSELARILTGMGIVPVADMDKPVPKVDGFIREGLFQFNPRQHDDGYKLLLGRLIQPSGWGEVEQVIDLLSRHPSTARHVSRKLIQYWVADDPPPDLVASTAAVFAQTDGDLKAVVRHIILSDAFEASLGTQYKSSWQYVVSVLRLTHPQRPPEDMKYVMDSLERLGQPAYGRTTPDGYSLVGASWQSPAMLLARFEFAERMVALGERSGQLSREQIDSMLPIMGADSRRQIALARSDAERALRVLTSPEFMYR